MLFLVCGSKQSKPLAVLNKVDPVYITQNASKLTPLTELDAYPLHSETQELIQQAILLTNEQGGGRLTTSFVLAAMVSWGEQDDAPPLLRLFYRQIFLPNPDAYIGVMAAYNSWFRHDVSQITDQLGHSGEVNSITPYFLAVLNRAQSIARIIARKNKTDPIISLNHLLVAMLSFDPGVGRVQPGAQYLITLFGLGLERTKAEILRYFRREQVEGVSQHLWYNFLNNL